MVQCPTMAGEARRESMIALRATHQAVRVARDVGYPAVDLGHVFCRHCNAELNWRHPREGFKLICPSCGEVSELPPHLRAHADRPPMALRERLWDWVPAFARGDWGPDYSLPTPLKFIFPAILVLTFVVLLIVVIRTLH